MSTRNIYCFQYKKENHTKFSQICRQGITSEGLKNEFETAVVNEPSVFEPLKFYCTCFTGCPPGEHLIGGACEFCPKGTVKPEPGQLPCQECEKGTYQDMEGQQACKPCGLGYFTDTTGQEVCKQCPSGMFANTPGSQSCEQCPSDMPYSSSDRSACK